MPQSCWLCVGSVFQRIVYDSKESLKKNKTLQHRFLHISNIKDKIITANRNCPRKIILKLNIKYYDLLYLAVFLFLFIFFNIAT